MSQRTEALRALPSVDRLLGTPQARRLLEIYARGFVAAAIRAELDEQRAAALGGATPPTVDALMARIAERAARRAQSSLRRVLNASGIVLHTNLGRAELARAAIEAVTAAAGTVNLEYDLESGARGDRDHLVEADLCALTGAEAATVVNNNAAAVLLALNTLAQGKEVIVSRGELIEIGGSFRLPEVLEKSGARLREVGTTNRTHAADYEGAIGAETGALLKVHTSNYRIIGFTAAVPVGDLVSIGRRHGLPVIEDLGSGALVDLRTYGLPKEPVVAEEVAYGPDAVTFSGDKLLGGPQAGVIVGRRAVIEKIKRNPLKRALRCDKMTLAALAATLRLYLVAPDLTAALPALRWLTRPLAEIAAVAEEGAAVLRQLLGSDYRVEIVPGVSQIGSGALPTEEIETRVLAVSHPEIGADAVAARFRAAEPAVIGRIADGRFLLDLRTVESAAQLQVRLSSERRRDREPGVEEAAPPARGPK